MKKITLEEFVCSLEEVENNILMLEAEEFEMKTPEQRMKEIKDMQYDKAHKNMNDLKIQAHNLSIALQNNDDPTQVEELEQNKAITMNKFKVAQGENSNAFLERKKANRMLKLKKNSITEASELNNNIGSTSTAENTIDSKNNAIEAAQKHKLQIKKRTDLRLDNINKQIENLQKIKEKIEGSSEDEINKADKTIESAKEVQDNSNSFKKVIQSSEQKDAMTGASLTGTQTESASLTEAAMAPEQIAFSGEVGKVADRILNGTEYEDPMINLIADKMQESAIVRNIMYKFNVEINKVNPDREKIKELKLKLGIELRKCKRHQ